MNLIDLLCGRNHNSTKGKIHLRNCSGEPVTVTKEIRYTVKQYENVTLSNINFRRNLKWQITHSQK